MNINLSEGSAIAQLEKEKCSVINAYHLYARQYKNILQSIIDQIQVEYGDYIRLMVGRMENVFCGQEFVVGQFVVAENPNFGSKLAVPFYLYFEERTPYSRGYIDISFAPEKGEILTEYLRDKVFPFISECNAEDLIEPEDVE